jgi:hypothetical protein
MQKRIALRTNGPKSKVFHVKVYNAITLELYWFNVETISVDMALEFVALNNLGFKNTLLAKIETKTIWRIHDYVMECFTSREYSRLSDYSRFNIPQPYDTDEDERYVPDFDHDSDFIATEQSDEMPRHSGIFEGLLDFDE